MSALLRLRRHWIVRKTKLALSIAAVLLATAVVSTLTIDLGPGLRGLAERQGSRYMKRTLHIGELRIRLINGHFEIHDLVIEGLQPSDRPFFTAKRLSLALDWLGLIGRQPDVLITSVELTDWEMLVEKFKDGDNFPKFRDTNAPPGGPRRITTTLRWLGASRGRFAYEDHETPWSIVAPNLNLTITNFPSYHGEATFKEGLISIQNYVPMWVNFKGHFRLDGPRVQLDRAEIDTDGARTIAVGAVDFDHWPEQTYQVRSRVQFSRMREIFFANENWKLGGDGDFTGVFHLFKGGHDLAGNFTSQIASVDQYRFPSLFGSLHWTRSFFEVTNAGSRLYGGNARFNFGIRPLGSPDRPVARFDASYEGVDLAQISDLYSLAGVRFAGSASGRNLLEWPLGKFSEHRGDGQVVAVAPNGAVSMPASLTEARSGDRDHALHEWGPFAPTPLADHIPVGGEIAYRYGPDAVDVSNGRFITESSHVGFSGRTTWTGDQAAFHFHVVSGDWQESDEVLAGIMTDFGARTGPVTFGGRGEFDGDMTGSMRRPRVEGRFSGEDMRAWDTNWGAGEAHIVVENNYLTVTDGVIRDSDSEIRAEGLFSLGYPRSDGGEEINARFRVDKHDLASLRHAFQLDAWPVTGRLSGEFHLTGDYQRPIGFGGMTIDDGVAYGEPFQTGAASLRFDGEGVRLDAATITKATGSITGAAFVGWDGTYSFNADGRRIPAESVAAFAFPKAPPSGTIEFTAAGSSTFENPRYDVRFRINELSVGKEPVGLVTGTLALRGQEINGEADVSSSRLAVTGIGRIALNEEADGELTFRFHDSSLDPYVRLFVPKLSPYTTAVASGTLRIVGELTDVDHLLVEGTVDTLNVTLFDYAIHNARPIRLALDQNVVRVQDLQLAGDDTQLTVDGSVSLKDERIALRASGDANLGILQGFFRDVRGSGRAALTAGINGPLYNPVFSGSATINGGRIRHFSLPNSLDAINGTIRFDPTGVRLDDITATMGGGRVQFGGRVGFEGYMPGELNVSVRGEDMHLRYPEGVRSTVDADLVVSGNVQAIALSGAVTVKNAIWNSRLDPNASIFDFGRGRSTAPEVAPVAAPAPVPLRFDVEVRIPSTLRVENNLARLIASADLQLRGTYDRPLIFGRAEVDRGEVTFEGRRYLVTRGNIDFTNPTKIEPFLDVEAETRVRVPGQTYQVTVRALGTVNRLQPELSSDPPLPAADVLALLFSDVRRTNGPGDVEVRNLQQEGRSELEYGLIRTRATQLIAGPVSSEVGRIVEQTFGVDTFQLTPSVIDPYSQSTRGLNPSARVTIGKRISDRAYLTFSRNLSSSSNDQILLLEYDESDRLSWILSRNEDATYAIEVRVRHAF
ncbi:MAG TPA: translocation/assembly module TamB domain-containing protein [Vicinamibacterales bacterium]